MGVAEEGESLGEGIIPKGKIGFATVCSAVVTGALLKAGVPMDSKFGGILQIRNRKPLRFAELIYYYSGTSLDPSEVFIRGKMTDVSGAAKKGDGKVLGSFVVSVLLVKSTLQRRVVVGDFAGEQSGGCFMWVTESLRRVLGSSAVGAGLVITPPLVREQAGVWMDQAPHSPLHARKLR